MAQSAQIQFIDIGVNLTSNRFDKDREQVLARALEADVEAIIITGTNARESQQALELAQQYEHCYATAGCHPHDAERMTDAELEAIKALHKVSKVVAVGECGLDFNRNFSTPDNQIQVFRKQLELACELQKPLFLHERDASDTMLELLQEYQAELPPAVIHCFTGSEQALERYLELGLYIGITGWICDERRGQELANMVHRIPDDKLMLETDAPWLTPRDLKPKPKDGRNEPMFLSHIAQKVANCRQQSLEHVASISYHNAKHFFGLKS
ncbi:TatD family hydrolase [Kangiella koreensis]|uniref:Hydrolase, TatD family n=1 Tax=Kangiella koreensis (strain DSM 16069 / JCM 12317 / KCTC 12182 / SW-125) TaxID=523791 RepID=C7R8B8_KANKD|nr:TatD family hydrolase [Kangiella koreensis]ACV27683.1 hydrolase, TatD family [Kangiella koreensis DSM 16069]